MIVSCPQCQRSLRLKSVVVEGDIVCPLCQTRFRLEHLLTVNHTPQGEATLTVAPNSATAPQPTPPAPSEVEGRTLGKFRLLTILGQGGFGTVYKARDTELDRVVALKVPRAGSLAGEQDIDRFLREARSAAQLRHPGIVSMHEVGQHDGLPYLVSDFVAGTTLAQRLTEQRPTPAQAATWIAGLADALAYAHGQGVIHRDVKPSNIMLGERDAPFLMDFGLAKREAGEATMTVEGQILGTPAYMSPEQARGEGHQVDGRTDVYSLGVVLYQMLAGTLPFQGSPRLLMHQVLHEEPRPPRALQDNVPRDLETICLKAMAKEPGRRYASAAELAGDLRRYLDGQPIHARPVGRLERGWRWCRRNPLAAGLATAFVLSLLLGAGVAGYFAFHMAEQARLAKEHSRQVEVEQERARQEYEERRRLDYTTQLSLAIDAWERGDLGGVQRLLGGLAPRPHEEDLRDRHWHYLWQQCHAHRFSVPGFNGVFADAGRSLLAGTRQELNVWDVASGQLRRRLASGEAQFVGFTFPDGALGFVRCDANQGVTAYRVEADKPLELLNIPVAKVFGVHEVNVDAPAMTVSADGRRLLVRVPPRRADGPPSVVTVWDLTTGKQLPTPSGLPQNVRSCALSRDGSTAVFGGTQWNTPGGFAPVEVRLHDTDTGKLLHAATREAGSPDDVAFSPDGDRLALAVNLWDSQEGRYLPGSVTVLSARDGKPLASCAIETPISRVAFSPDGKQLAAGPSQRGPLRLWDAGTGERLADLWGSPQGVKYLAFTPDGRTLAGAGVDGMVRVWNLEPPAVKRSSTLPFEKDLARAVAFTADGRTLVSVGLDHTARLWDVATGKERGVLHGHRGPLFAVSCSADGRRIATGGEDRRVLLWRSDGVLEGEWTEREAIVSLAFSPTQERLAVGVSGGPVTIYSLNAALQPPKVTFLNVRPRALAFRPDGKQLAVAAEDGTVRLVDSGTGQLSETFNVRHPNVWTLAFSADGAQLATGGTDPALALWDARTGKSLAWSVAREYNPTYVLEIGGLAFSRVSQAFVLSASYGQTGRVMAHAYTAPHAIQWQQTNQLEPAGGVAASADGTRVAVCRRDGTITLLDGTNGAPLHLLPGHAHAVLRLAFHPDGATLAEVRADRTIRLRDRRTGRELHRLEGHAERITALVFSRRGDVLASASHDNAIRLWDSATGKLLRTVTTTSREAVRSLALSPDGKRLAAGDGYMDGYGNDVWVWNLERDEKPLRLHPHGWAVWELCFAPDGKRLAAVTGSMWKNLHGNVVVWDAATGERLAAAGNVHPTANEVIRSAREHTWRISGAAFSPDGRWLATAGRDHVIRLWDLEDLSQPRLLSGHANTILALAFSPNGAELVSSGEDQTLRCWDVAAAREKLRLQTAALRCLAVSPDGQTVAGAELSGLVRFWDVAAPEYVASGRQDSTDAQREREALVRLRLAELAARQGDEEVSLASLRAASAALSRGDGAAARLRHVAEKAIELGNALVRKGRHAAAKQAHDEAVRLHPDKVLALTTIAVALRASERYEEAIERRREVAALQPQNAEAHFALGSLLVNRQRNEEALVSLREATRLRPTHVVAWVDTSYALLNLQRYAEALEASRAALRLQPTHDVALNNQGVALRELKRLDEAVASLRAAVRANPASVLAQRNLGHVLLLRKETDEGLAVLRTALRLAPTAVEVHRELCSALIDADRLDEAEVACAEGLRLVPSATTYGQLAYLRTVQRRFEESMAAYREAMRRAPGDPRYPHAQAGALWLFDHRLEALAAYEAASKLAPHSARYHCSVGRALRELNRLKEAEARFRTAIRCEPSHAQGHVDLAHLLLKTNRPAESLAPAREALRLRPGDTTMLVNLGTALFELKQHDEAIAAYREALRHDATLGAAHRSLGNCLRASGKSAEAVAPLREAARLQPNEAGTQYDFGIALEETGDLAEAGTAFDRAWCLAPTWHKVYWARARVFEKQKDWEMVLATWREAQRVQERYGTRLYLVVALVGRADGLVRCPRGELRDPLEALRLAQHATKLQAEFDYVWLTLADELRPEEWRVVEEELSRTTGPQGTLGEWLLLALAQAQRGERDLARRWYERAASWMERRTNRQEMLQLRQRVERWLGSARRS